ncbi:putative nADP-dependent oxidoreductase yfmJ [Mycobacterium kansasii 732]|nr:putative nADP-dependent oxidoreductase yfmJ [Mycobacterium kansasii 732]
MPDLPNRQIVLRRRPTGLVQSDDTELVTSPAPRPAPGEALLRTTYVGIDAAARTWLDDQPGYLPPVQLGEVIRAAGIGEVVETRCDAYTVGDVVTTLTGFQEYVIIRDDVFSTPIPGESDQLAIMSVYGPTGATAYFGMTDIGRPKPGETVVVSAAAAPPDRWPGRSPRSPEPGWWASPAGRRSAGRWSKTSDSTRVSTTRTRTWPPPSKRTAPSAWTSTSTTSVAPSSTRCWAGSPTTRGWCCAVSSPVT